MKKLKHPDKVKPFRAYLAWNYNIPVLPTLSTDPRECRSKTHALYAENYKIRRVTVTAC